jgi:hypothetical protein
MFPEGCGAFALRFDGVVIPHCYIQVSVRQVVQQMFVIAEVVRGTRVNEPD